MTNDLPTTPATPESLPELKKAIAARLRRVCPDMPADEFDQMVERITAVELKYEYGYGDGTSRGTGRGRPQR